MLKIVATSDLHGDLPKPEDMPSGDVLVLAGDILPDDFHFKWRDVIGTTRIERQGWWFQHVFIPWLAEVKHIIPEKGIEKWEKRYKHFIITGGNHDFFLNAMMPSGVQKMLPKRTHYLSEGCVEIDGITFFGAGWNMTRGWAFAHDNTTIADKLKQMPTGVDVMVVHTPPFIDGLSGHHCPQAVTDYLTANPKKAYICGHIHEAYGSYKVGDTPVYVVSRKDRKYEDTNPFVEITI